MGTYKYEPLEGREWIRLLTFTNTGHPDHDPMKSLQLVHRPLADNGNYETLSYSWGESILSSHVKLQNGQDLLVTPTLETALPHILRRASHGQIWIDQICINQMDLVERSSQVALMGEIYLGSQQVLVWLGPSSWDLIHVSEMLNVIGTQPGGSYMSLEDGESFNAQKEGLKDTLRQYIDLEEPGTKSNRELKPGQVNRKAITEFMSRRWWSRAWVFQEVILSRKIKLVAGDYIFHWNDIRRVAFGVNEIEYEKGGWRDSLIKRSTGYESAQELWSRHHNYGKNPVVNDFFKFMLNLQYHFRATDIRDFIFAFSAFENDLGLKFKPDYTQPAGVIFRIVTRQFIRKLGNLDILAYVPGGYLPSVPELPAWSPYYAGGRVVPWPVHHAAGGEGSPFCASGDYKLKLPDDFEEQGKVLHLRGKAIDIVEGVHSHAFEKHYYMNGIGPYLNLDAITHHINTSTTCNRYSQVNRERVLRVIIGEIPIRKRHDVGRRKDGYLKEELIASLLYAVDNEAAIKANESRLKDLEKGKESLKNLQSAVIITQSQRVFWTKGNRIGLMASGCRAGDHIIIFHGCMTPYVCRFYRNQWVPIAQCFLEGMMFGERVDWKEDEADNFELI